MDATLKAFFDAKKSLINDTKIPGSKKQSTKPPKGNMNKPLEEDHYKRFAASAIKDLPSKKDLVDKMQQFIDSEEAKL
jgi:hypothetical protein